MKKGIFQKLRDKRGQGLVEYALIVALIAVVAIVALRTIGTEADRNLDNVATELGNVADPV